MPYTVTEESILDQKTDAAVLGVEICLSISDGPSCRSLAEAGGPALQEALNRLRFLPIGSAAAIELCGLPFRHLILAAAPRWLTGKANELLALRRCYESVFRLAEEQGCESLASPFLSALSYRFPRREAVHEALRAAEQSPVRAVFTADTPELLHLSREDFHRPEIRSYVGYYRDHAIFELDNGLFARVDLRPENRDVTVIPYFEACYQEGNNPLQPPLPEQERARLRQIVESWDW